MVASVLSCWQDPNDPAGLADAVGRAAANDWRAAAWMLERHPLSREPLRRPWPRRTGEELVAEPLRPLLGDTANGSSLEDMAAVIYSRRKLVAHGYPVKPHLVSIPRLIAINVFHLAPRKVACSLSKITVPCFNAYGYKFTASPG
jgi:hypothetical protein